MRHFARVDHLDDLLRLDIELRARNRHLPNVDNIAAMPRSDQECREMDTARGDDGTMYNRIAGSLSRKV